MGEKCATLATVDKAPERLAGRQLAQKTPNPLFGLQQSFGNQAMLRLLESGAIQAKLRVSQPGDADEIEADRVAERVVSARPAPVIQRKCGCSGGPSCAKCAEEEEGAIHRSVAGTIHRQSQPSGQPPATDQAPGQDVHPQDRSAAQSPARQKGPSLIVDDEAGPVAPGQMKKSQFLQQLRASVCATADAALAAVGRNSKSCPYIEHWLSFYSSQGADRIERALHKYAPGSDQAKHARDYISFVTDRVRQAVTVWAATGRVTGVPAGAPVLPGASSGSGVDAASAGPAVQGSGPSGAAASPPAAQGIHAKGRDSGATSAADPQAVRERLGPGRPLDSGVRSRMEPAFGHDFSRVRLHTDSTAAQLSNDLNARAFTVGESIAFAPGEYKPGTLVGDALMAHELAHVVQQGESGVAAPQRKSEDESAGLEQDADYSAVRAVLSIWQSGKRYTNQIGRNALPALKSGLRLQRCQTVKKVCPRHYSWRVQNTTGMGSLGCLCHWKCLPGDPPSPPSDQMEFRCAQGVDCSTGVRYEELDSSYTQTGFGAAFTPVGEDYCGCFPLDEEGRKISDVPLRPTDFQLADVLGPAADVVGARSGAKPRTDPTTGKPKTQEAETGPAHETAPRGVVMGGLGRDVEVGNLRVADYRGKFEVGRGRNIAFADYDIAGDRGTLVGVSGKAEREGTVSVPADPQFPTVIAGHPRTLDSEKKILEHIADKLGENPEATGTINLFSERDVCVGCDIVIAQFRKKYPKIQLNVISGKK